MSGEKVGNPGDRGDGSQAAVTGGLAGPGEVVLVVHAHPDDEVFATGAATIEAAASGARVHLRVFTGGEGRDVPEDPGALAEARARKAAALASSAATLGFTDWGYVTEPGQWIDAPHLPHRTLARADLDGLALAVARIIDDLAPDLVLTVGPDGLTGHPDHVRCHAAVTRALAARPPARALGAVLDRAHVAAAEARARAVFGERVGSGAVTGQGLTPDWVRVTARAGAGERRRVALDAYLPGLGTMPVHELPTTLARPGDSVLLRFVLDASGWDRDWFVPLSRPRTY